MSFHPKVLRHSVKHGFIVEEIQYVNIITQVRSPGVILNCASSSSLHTSIAMCSGNADNCEGFR